MSNSEKARAIAASAEVHATPRMVGGVSRFSTCARVCAVHAHRDEGLHAPSLREEVTNRGRTHASFFLFLFLTRAHGEMCVRVSKSVCRKVSECVCEREIERVCV